MKRREMMMRRRRRRNSALQENKNDNVEVGIVMNKKMSLLERDNTTRR
jgi:hypothetical protein